MGYYVDAVARDVSIKESVNKAIENEDVQVAFEEVKAPSLKSSLRRLRAETAVQALPPNVQRQREMEAILREAYKHIPDGESIMQITKTEYGYEIITDHYSIPVEIHFLPQENIGPARFEVIFQRPVSN